MNKGAVIKYSVYQGGRDFFNDVFIFVPHQKILKYFHTPPKSGIKFSYPTSNNNKDITLKN